MNGTQKLQVTSIARGTMVQYGVLRGTDNYPPLLNSGPVSASRKSSKAAACSWHLDGDSMHLSFLGALKAFDTISSLILLDLDYKMRVRRLCFTMVPLPSSRQFQPVTGVSYYMGCCRDCSSPSHSSTPVGGQEQGQLSLAYVHYYPSFLSQILLVFLVSGGCQDLSERTG